MTKCAGRERSSGRSTRAGREGVVPETLADAVVFQTRSGCSKPERESRRFASGAAQVERLGAAPAHGPDTLPLPLLDLEQRVGAFDQVTVLIEGDLARDARDRDLRQTVGNLLPVERVGVLNGLDHRECGVIRERRVQFHILVEARLVALAEVLGRGQLVERRAWLQIL